MYGLGVWVRSARVGDTTASEAQIGNAQWEKERAEAPVDTREAVTVHPATTPAASERIRSGPERSGVVHNDGVITLGLHGGRSGRGPGQGRSAGAGPAGRSRS